MESFDDLLSNSKSNPILENPFEDPFARPRSPDPWLTFSNAQSRHEEHTPTAEHHLDSTIPDPQHSGHSEEREQAAPDTADPLDAKAANENEDVEPELRVPRQSSDADSSLHPSPITSPITGTPAAEPAKTLSPEVESEETPAASSTPPASPPPQSSDNTEREHDSPAKPPDGPSTPSVSQASPNEVKHQGPSSTTKTESPSKQIGTSTSVVSPLESGGTNEQTSFATLALGGEMPGWQGSLAQSTFVNQGSVANLDDPSVTEGWNENLDGESFVNGAPVPEDSDDDVPIAKVHPGTLSPPAATGRGPDIQPTFVITVGDPQKVGELGRAFITYTVHTRTTSPLYRRSAFSVLRRYSDFLWLYETLSTNNPGVIVPPVPEKQQYGRFEGTFVENRRAALTKCIQKTANHPALQNDPDLKLFLESDSFVLDIKHRKAEIAHERGGLMASIGNTLVGPRFYETDEWFDAKRSYLDSLESQLRGLVKAIDIVSKQRNEVAVAMADFAENIAALGTCDMSKHLSQSLSMLADVQKVAKALQDIQAREDVSTVMSTVDEYARLVNSVRLAFSSRVRLYGTWQIADSELKRSQQTHDKARRQGKIPPERLSSSLSEIAEAERRATEAKQDFENASKLIKSELARFEQERVEDFKNALVTFLEGMVSRQKEIIHAWEGYQESLLKRFGPNSGSAPASG